MGNYVLKVGDTMSGNLAMGGNKVTGLGAPSATGDAAIKSYVDGRSSNGSYAGDSSVNKAIAHGLGVIPRYVRLWMVGATNSFSITAQQGYISYYGASNGALAVTAPDATNFYVGNATNYTLSANGAYTYYWMAIA